MGPPRDVEPLRCYHEEDVMGCPPVLLDVLGLTDHERGRDVDRGATVLLLIVAIRPVNSITKYPKKIENCQES